MEFNDLVTDYRKALDKKNKLLSSKGNFGKPGTTTDQYSEILKNLPGLLNERARKSSR